MNAPGRVLYFVDTAVITALKNPESSGTFGKLKSVMNACQYHFPALVLNVLAGHTMIALLASANGIHADRFTGIGGDETGFDVV